METRHTIDPLQPKTWQIDQIEKGSEGYLYHCILCDEALVLSKQQVNPRKIKLVFDGTCPSCGFELDRVLGCRASPLPPGRRLLTSLKCKDPELLREPDDQIEYQTRRGSNLPRDLQPGITTGIEFLDKALILKTGQFVFLEGEPSHTLSLLLCVRATLSQGLDSDVVVKEWADKAGGLLQRIKDEFHELDKEGRQDAQSMETMLERMLFEIQDLRAYSTRPTMYALQLSATPYISREYAPVDARISAVNKHLRPIPGFLDQASRDLAPTLPDPIVEVAIKQTQGVTRDLDGDVARQAETANVAIREEFDRAKADAIT